MKALIVAISASVSIFLTVEAVAENPVDFETCRMLKIESYEDCHKYFNNQDFARSVLDRARENANLLVPDNDPEYIALKKKYGVADGNKPASPARSALSIFIAAVIAVAVAFFFRKSLAGASTDNTPSQVARRWMAFGVMLGVIKMLVGGLSHLFAGTSGAAKEFATGFVLTVVYGLGSYIIGFIWGKIRYNKNEAAQGDWVAEAKIATTESSVSTAILSGSPHPTSVNEAAIYEKVALEIETGNTDKAIWTKAFALADGDEKKTKANYIKLRFAALSSSA